MQKSYDFIDLCKFFFAVSIVGLHTGFCRDFSPEISFIVVSLCSRLAVPFFFCAGGFFLFSKWRNSVQPQKSIAILQAKRVLILYIVWACIKFLYVIGRVMLKGGNAGEAALSSLWGVVTLSDGYYWYLQVQAIMTLVLGIFCTTEKKTYFATGFFSLCYVFLLLLERISIDEKYVFLLRLQDFFANQEYIFKLVVGGLFLSIGGCVHAWKQKTQSPDYKKQLIGIFSGVLCLIIELILVFSMNVKDYDNISYFLALPVIAAFILKLGLSVKIHLKQAKTLRNLSILIYVTHYITRGVVSSLVEISYFVYFVATLAISTILGLMILKLSEKYKVFRWLY